MRPFCLIIVHSVASSTQTDAELIMTLHFCWSTGKNCFYVYRDHMNHIRVDFEIREAFELQTQTVIPSILYIYLVVLPQIIVTNGLGR